MQSDLYKCTNQLLNTYENDERYQIEPYRTQRIQTITMEEALEKLKLRELYGQYIDANKWLLGIHGDSIQALPQIIPSLQGIKKIPKYHNRYHREDSPLWFFYGDNVRMSLHYSNLNSINTDSYNDSRDNFYYPRRVGVVGFADTVLIEHINQTKLLQCETKVPIRETIAWGKTNKNRPPRNFKIGKEILIEQKLFNLTMSLPVFSIKGRKRGVVVGPRWLR